MWSPIVMDYTGAAHVEQIDYSRIHISQVNEFRRFLSQFSSNFHEIMHTLFSSHVVTTLKVSRSFDKYLRS